MKRYKVTLLQKERQELEALTRKGSHQSQRVINALILLNYDEGEWNRQRACGEDVAHILHISMRKLDRVKKRFVEERLEAALGRRKGGRQYKRKADGALRGPAGGAELWRAAERPRAVVTTSVGRSSGRT